MNSEMPVTEQALSEMPPLPEPVGYESRTLELIYHPSDAPQDKSRPVFSIDATREYARQAVLAERERCADLCDEMSWNWKIRPSVGGDGDYHSGCYDCGEGIRAQK